METTIGHVCVLGCSTVGKLLDYTTASCLRILAEGTMFKGDRPVADGSYIDRAAGFGRRQLPVASADHPGIIPILRARN